MDDIPIRLKNEENITSRSDHRFSHHKGTDVLSLMKKFLKPIVNPLISMRSLFSPRVTNSKTISSHKTSRKYIFF